MLGVYITINGVTIFARTAVNRGPRKPGGKGGCRYECDDGSIIYHHPDAGAVVLAKRLLDTIAEEPERKPSWLEVIVRRLDALENESSISAPPIGSILGPQQDLPPDAAKVLRENLWNLYETLPTPAQSAGQETAGRAGAECSPSALIECAREWSYHEPGEEPNTLAEWVEHAQRRHSTKAVESAAALDARKRVVQEVRVGIGEMYLAASTRGALLHLVNLIEAAPPSGVHEGEVRQ